jgi:hypothetical protein
MRPSTYVHILFHSYCCYNWSAIRIKVITKETNSLYGTNIKTQFSHIIYTEWRCSFLTSAVIMGAHMGVMSKLG